MRAEPNPYLLELNDDATKVGPELILIRGSQAPYLAC